MSILWDAPLTAAVARELADRLRGAALRAVRMDRASRDLVLHFRERTLVFRLHPLRGDVALLPPSDPAPGSVTLKATLRGVRNPPDERLLLFQLQPPAGGAAPEGIVVELMTNQWNAVWLEVGRDRIRRVLWKRETGKRILAAGEIYRPPTPSDRLGIEAPLNGDDWLDLLGGVEPGRRRGVLLRSVAFTSSLNVPALLGPDRIPGSGAPEGEPRETRCDEDVLLDGHRLWLALRAVSLGQDEVDPCLVETPERTFPYPVPLRPTPGGSTTPFPSVLKALEAAAEEDADGESTGAALLPSSLLERLDEAVADAKGKAARLRQELEEAPHPEPIRRTGDLILARFGEVGRGAERVVLEGFEGDPVAVELDPALAPDENAQRYYREAARVERARERLPELIRKADRETEELCALRERAMAGEVAPEELEERLPSKASRRRGGGEPEGPKLPYRRYRSSGGLEIRVGRGARSNDELTFHHSSPDDVWLHARQVTGAHVVLRWQDPGNPPARDLAEAASLAALHSDARHASSVPVDWTRRKYVRSPRKAPPGLVIPDRVQTVFVDPDRGLERKLREE